jgi:hypothetical protein
MWPWSEAGSVITSQGDAGDTVWFIKRGAAKLVYNVPGRDLKDAIHLGTAGAG